MKKLIIGAAILTAGAALLAKYLNGKTRSGSAVELVKEEDVFIVEAENADAEKPASESGQQEVVQD